MNNYDQSSSGENIEFSAHYSCDLASMFFDDFQRENTRIDFGRDCVMFLLGDCEAAFYKKSTLQKMAKIDLYTECQDLELIAYYENELDYTKQDLIDLLCNVTIEEYYQFLTANNTWHELSEKIPHSFYISRGYSQGDAVYIVALDDDITKEKRQYIDRVLWDSPISIYCTVNNQEFFEDDFLIDQYEWDRDNVAEKVKALPVSDYAKNWIIEALPEYPDYS